MKKLILTATLIASATMAYSQGIVGFADTLTPGYVVQSADPHTSSAVTGTYEGSPNFTAALYSLTGNVLTTAGLGVDSYGYINSYSQFLSDSFNLQQTTLGGSANGVSAGNGYFVGNNQTITGTTGGFSGSSYTAFDVLAVAAWTGGYETLALAEASGTADIGIIAFVNPIGPGGADPHVPGLTGWPTTASPASIANEAPGYPELIMSPVPEPTTIALGALGGLSLLLFRRKQA
jgi:hypothetical protein